MRLLASLLLASLLPAPCSGSAAPPQRAEVVSVTDGDTLVVRLGTVKEKVRLVGIDAPERDEYFGREATAFVRSVAQGKTVRLIRDGEQDDRDAYGRLLRYVELPDGRTLNAELVSRGLAFVYERFRFDRKREFRDLEAAASAGGIGIWANQSIPELRWLEREGGDAITLLPMTDRSWAVRWRGMARLHVRGADLSRTLEQLRRALDQENGDAEAALASQGWIRVPDR